MRGLAGIVVALLLLAGCDTGSPPSPSLEPTAVQTPRGPDTPSSTPPPISDVPQETLSAILEDAASRTGVAPERQVIEHAESVVWSDGALGCPAPGEVYIQVLIDGYWVRIRAGEELLDYRVGGGGSFKLCPPGRGRPPAGGIDAVG